MIVSDLGKNNTIVGAHEHISGAVTFHGDNGRVEIVGKVRGEHVEIDLGSDSSVSIGDAAYLSDAKIFLGHTCTFLMDSSVSVSKGCKFLMHEPSRCHIGYASLFAAHVVVATTDMHPIFDRASGERINPAENVVIGRDVWIGDSAYIMKGVTIGHGSVVGARSVVTASTPENVIVAGNPARVIRENIAWRFKL